MRPWFWRHQEPQGAWKREVAGAGGCSAAWAIQVARLVVAGAGVCRRCDAVGAVKTAEVTGARGCSAAWATKVARLAVAGGWRLPPLRRSGGGENRRGTWREGRVLLP